MIAFCAISSRELGAEHAGALDLLLVRVELALDERPRRRDHGPLLVGEPEVHQDTSPVQRCRAAARPVRTAPSM